MSGAEKPTSGETADSPRGSGGPPPAAPGGALTAANMAAHDAASGSGDDGGRDGGGRGGSGGRSGPRPPRNPMEWPDANVNKYVPADFPGLDTATNLDGTLSNPAPIDVINRLYNLRDGNPDMVDTRPEVVAKLMQVAKNQPLFRGKPPKTHPYPWLFDGVAPDPKDMNYNVTHLRENEVRASAALAERICVRQVVHARGAPGRLFRLAK